MVVALLRGLSPMLYPMRLQLRSDTVGNERSDAPIGCIFLEHIDACRD